MAFCSCSISEVDLFNGGTFSVQQRPQFVFGQGRELVLHRVEVVGHELLELQGGNAIGEREQHRVLEQLAQGEVHQQASADAPDQLDGEQRVPAKLEEIIVAADLRKSEQFDPDLRQGLL